MGLKSSLFLIIAFFLAMPVFSDSPVVVDAPLPLLEIPSHGEVVLEDDEYRYAPWSSHTNPGQVHIVQYLAGTLAASKTYRPFTDTLLDTYELSQYHVTTIINLDDALWGTSGFVTSQVKSNKREYPHSTLVLDEDGKGRDAWQLEKKGCALLIINSDGKVLYYTTNPMSDADQAIALAIMKEQIDG